jgi:hypothetical protein
VAVVLVLVIMEMVLELEPHKVMVVAVLDV